MNYTQQHLQEAAAILGRCWTSARSSGWSECAGDLKATGGRVFFLGVGGSAANCSHAVNDFRKLLGIECTPQRITSRSSPPASTTRVGKVRSSNGSK